MMVLVYMLGGMIAGFALTISFILGRKILRLERRERTLRKRWEAVFKGPASRCQAIVEAEMWKAHAAGVVSRLRSRNRDGSTVSIEPTTSMSIEELLRDGLRDRSGGSG